jgi:dipeptidyl-peptidase-4
MLVDSLKLSSGKELSEAEKMQRERQRIGDLKGIVSYEWAPDGKAVLVPLDGDLFLAGLDGSVRRIPGTQGGELNPKLGPKGDRIAYVRDRRLWVGAVAGQGAPVAVTPAESAETVHWGEAEFVAQEEMSRFAGFWWSPDESRLAVERFDEAKVGVVTRAAIGAEGTKTFDQRYPAAGTPNAEVSLWIMAPDGSGRVAVDLGRRDKDIYLARVDWARRQDALCPARNRAQTRLDMLAVDPATGKARVLFSEQAAERSWINLSDSYRFLADGSLIWWSERDGFGHLYRFRPDHYPDSQWQQLTQGDWVVTGLVGVDQKAGRVFFTGTKDGVLAQQVYALDLAAPSKIVRLTDPGFRQRRDDGQARPDADGHAQCRCAAAAVLPGRRCRQADRVDRGESRGGIAPYAPYLAAIARRPSARSRPPMARRCTG